MKSTITRRQLISTSVKTVLVLPFVGLNLSGCNNQGEENSEAEEEQITPLKILILGGTSFLGPHQIAYALSRGHSVSTFTRGKTKPTIYQDLFEQVEQLVGDRENDLTALEGRKWDVVIDNSGRNVDWVKKSTALLKDKAERYLFTSSTGVYFPYLEGNLTEDKEIVMEVPEGLADDDYDKMEYEYGVMKANCELEVQKAFGEDRAIAVRPIYMIGPADKTNRFIHWPLRLAKGGDVLVPGKSDDPVQYIDVRDVAEFMIRLLEQKKAGTYNSVGPELAETMPQFIEKAAKAFDVEFNFIQVDDYQFLEDNKVFFAVPWVPPTGKHYGVTRVSNQKALEAGLTYRDLATTVKDTYDWWHSDALTDEQRTKYEADEKGLLVREAEVLENWAKFSTVPN